MAAPTPKPRPAPVDWLALARKLQSIQADMIHRDTESRYGDDFYAEALRRTFGYRAQDGTDGGRELPYDSVNQMTGLTTVAAADYTRDGHTIIDRMNREAAEKQRDEARAETRAVMVDAAQRLSDYIREWCNERRVPSRYRREGALYAADVIDPRVRKDRFGNPVDQPHVCKDGTVNRNG